MTTLDVVIAPDSFKGTLPATGVARAIADGWLSVRPDDKVTIAPLADGGEGTLDAVEAAVPGSTRKDAGFVTGPDGRSVAGQWLALPDGTAVVELAQMSGLPLMAELDPLGATTYGLGQVITAALDSGAIRLVVGLGGSASSDAGAGALAALGLRARTGRLERGGSALAAVSGLDNSGLRLAPPGGVVLLTDVKAPLLGAAGAAAVFGPQKGAGPDDVETLDAAISHFARAYGGDPNAPGAGAAGGTAYGFATAWGASIRPGAEYITGLGDFLGAVSRADIVLSGEGRFDSTSLGGKLVGHIIRITPSEARVGIVAGAITSPPRRPDGTTIWSRSLTDIAGSKSAAMEHTEDWLGQAGASAARELGGAP